MRQSFTFNSNFNIFNSSCSAKNIQYNFNRNVVDFAWPKSFLCIGSTVLGFGEDPRAFVFQDKPACYSTLCRENYCNLNRLFIKNASGWDVLNLINEKSYSSGKNWTPFVWAFDFNKRSFSISKLAFDWEPAFKIVDPTAFYKVDGDYFLMTCETESIWGVNAAQKCRKCVYKLDLLGGNLSAPANL